MISKMRKTALLISEDECCSRIESFDSPIDQEELHYLIEKVINDYAYFRTTRLVAMYGKHTILNTKQEVLYVLDRLRNEVIKRL